MKVFLAKNGQFRTDAYGRPICIDTKSNSVLDAHNEATDWCNKIGLTADEDYDDFMYDNGRSIYDDLYVVNGADGMSIEERERIQNEMLQIRLVTRAKEKPADWDEIVDDYPLPDE